jgi:putrescine importer
LLLAVYASATLWENGVSNSHASAKGSPLNPTADSTQPAPGLHRSLKLWHLIVYGIVIIQPVAPMGIYGVVSNVARGHVVSTILIAMVAMLFTAVSYGRMARVYPSAGSAYTYVGRELHPMLGYVVGWSMLMDYILNPIICVIWCSAAARNVLPQIPYAAWAIAFAIVFTLLNLRGVRSSGRTNGILALFMSLVVAVFLAYAVRYIALVARPVGGEWLIPFYDPATFSASLLFRGTSIAVLTYIGFDGISTMSEEVENPRRNIMLATVLTCLVIGLLSAVEVYVAQLAWPAHSPFPPSLVDTAYVQVAERVGGRFLFHLLNATLLIANLGSGIAAQFGAARLLYGMGQGGSLPRRFFSAIDERTGIPRNNVILVGACALIGAFLLTYERGAELLNFGAFIAFMGVNAAALVHYGLRAKSSPEAQEKVPFAILIPLLGLLVSGFIWLNLNHSAQLLGILWVAVGLVLFYLMRRANPDTAVPEFE